MPPRNKKLFLSAVSSEFESYRRLLAGDLKRPTLEVAVQEDFLVTGGSTLQKLDDYIRACDGVVHLIGKATGAAPEAVAVQDLLLRYPDFATRLPSLAVVLIEKHGYGRRREELEEAEEAAKRWLAGRGVPWHAPPSVA
jgi:hypothetical protein